MIKLLERAATYKDRLALVSNSCNYTYDQLLIAAKNVGANLLDGQPDLKEARIAFLVPPSFEYTAVQWGIWMAGGIVVPLCVLHPLPSLRYVLEDTRANIVIAHPDYLGLLKPLEKEIGITLTSVNKVFEERFSIFPAVGPARRAMILYTSGTTSKPKGVVTTHANIEAQITTLVEAWEWDREDRILNILPLHHVHGIINVLGCALWSGASCEFLPKFDAETVWSVIKSGRLTLFMAVPTIYFKLISYWEQVTPSEQTELSNAASRLRLMVSGSAALPVTVLEKWLKITRQTLLERYGMTEIGMGLSNSYQGERRPGHVGLPLPGVEMRLVDADNNRVPDGEPGEIQIKGPSVFKEYWNNKESTSAAFTLDGWFITGDIANYNNGAYKILGRDSVDIIKSGGYKISALEIEDVLRQYPGIQDCAVVGIPDEEWGEVVSACLITGDNTLDTLDISSWLKERLPAYKIPRNFIRRKELPRNVLGKVTKNELKQMFGPNA